MLYIFAGFPGKALPPGSRHLHAGGLRHTVEVEHLGLLVEDGFIQYRKEGVFSVTPSGAEQLGAVQMCFSDLCLAAGIDQRWFPDGYAFGNGVSLPKTTALRETMVVDHLTGVSLSQMLGVGRVLDLRRQVERVYRLTEGWNQYEARWRPGTCPQESHVVHLTTLCFRHELPQFAYERLQQLIEAPGTKLHFPELYTEQHFSVSRRWEPTQPDRRDLW